MRTSHIVRTFARDHTVQKQTVRRPLQMCLKLPPGREPKLLGVFPKPLPSHVCVTTLRNSPVELRFAAFTRVI